MRLQLSMLALLALLFGTLCLPRANAADETIFTLAAKGDAAAVGRLLDADQTLVTAKDAQFGGTALHFAAAEGQDAVVVLLLKHGADPNLRNNEEQTPLHLAAANGQQSVLALLLAAGAQPNLQDKQGYTSLHYAATYGQQAAVTALLAANADAELEDRNGETPLFCAQEKGHAEVVAQLAAALRPGAMLLVDLDARDASAGTDTWRNRAGMGNFSRIGAPTLQTVGDIRAVCFDGQTMAYRGPIAPENITGQQPRTVEAWVYNPGPELPGNTIVAWGKRGGEGENCACCYGFHAGNTAFQGMGGQHELAWALAGRWTPQGVLSLQIKQWHHLAYVYDGDVMRVYLDGELNAVRALPLNTASNQPIMLCAQNEANGHPGFHNDITGPLDISSVRVWSGTASSEQIRRAYNRNAKRFGRPTATPLTQPVLAPASHATPQYPLGHPNFVPSPEQPVGYHGDGNGSYPGAVLPAVWWEGTHIERPNADGKGTYPDFADTVAHNIVWKTQMPSWANTHPIVVGDKIFTLGEPDFLYCVDARTGVIEWTRCVNAWEIAGIEPNKAKKIRELYDIYLALRTFERLPQNGPWDPGNYPLTGKQYQQLAQVFLAKDYARIMAALKQVDPETDYQAAGEDSVTQIRTLAASTADNITIMEIAHKELPLQSQVQQRISSLAGVFSNIPLDMAAWNFGGFCLPSPISDGKHVYVAFGQGQTCCFDLQGNLQWGHLFSAPEVGWVCSYLSPLLADGVLIDERGNHALRGLDAASGRLLWETTVAKDQDLDREDPFGNDKVLSLTNGNDSLTVLVTSRGPILRVADGKIVGALPLLHTQWDGSSLAGIGDVIFKPGDDPTHPFRAFKLKLESMEQVRAELLWECSGWGDSCGGIVTGNTVFFRSSVYGGAFELNTGVPLSPHGEFWDGSNIVIGNIYICNYGSNPYQTPRRRSDGKVFIRSCTLDYHTPHGMDVLSLNWMGGLCIPQMPAIVKYTPELLDYPDYFSSYGGLPYSYSIDYDPYTAQGNRLFFRSFANLYCIGDPTEPYCGTPTAPAISALDTPTSEGLPELLTRLAGPDRATRALAAQALKSFGAAGAPAVPRLLEMFNSGKDEAIEGAILGFRALGPAAEAAVDPLLQCYRTGEYPARVHAAAALARLGPRAAEAAARLAGEEKTLDLGTELLIAMECAPDIVARALAGVYAAREKASMRIKAPWRESDEQAWIVAEEALRRMGTSAAAAVPILLQQPRKTLHDAVALSATLGYIDPSADVALLPEIVSGLRQWHKDAEFRPAVDALAALGSRARPVLPDLLALRDDTNRDEARRGMLGSVAMRIARDAGDTVIGSISATPTVVAPGKSVTLSWAAVNADRVTLNPGAVSLQPVGTITLTPSTSTDYTITASGAKGTDSRSVQVQVLTPVAPVGVTELRPGLRVEYFATDGAAGFLPRFATMRPYRTEVTSRLHYDNNQVSFATSGRRTQVAARYTGYLKAPVDGIYYFDTNSDDGSALYIGDVLVVNNDGPRDGMTTATGEIALSAGWHPLTVLYAQGTGDFGLVVTWQVPEGVYAEIPVEALGHEEPALLPAGEQPGVRAEYFALEGSDGKLPAFDKLTPYATDVVPALVFGANPNGFAGCGRRDWVAARFSGQLTIPRDGVYSFYAQGKDVCGLTIGERTVIPYDSTRNWMDGFGAVQLKAGVYPITVNYCHTEGDYQLTVSWDGPGMEQQLLRPTGPGWQGTLYAFDAHDPGTAPDFAALKPIGTAVLPELDLRSDPSIFATSGRHDQVAARFTGEIDIPADGEYTFSTESDDSSVLLIDNKRVVENGDTHPMREQSGTITLKAGKHSLTLLYAQADGSFALIVRWEGPGVKKQVIPAGALWH